MRAWNHSQLQQFVINPWRDSMMGVEFICVTPKSICAHSTVPGLNNIKNTQIEQTKWTCFLSQHVIHALQYQDTIICINETQRIRGGARMTRTFFAVCLYPGECIWVKNPAKHKGSEEPQKILHQAQPPPPKSNHFTTLETTTNLQVQQNRDYWAWTKRAAMRLPNPVAKKQREAWEDGRMSCSNCRTRASAETWFLHSTLFWTLIQDTQNTWASHQSKALTSQETGLFWMEDGTNTAWKALCY